jgi:hypothetical protein
MINPMHNDRESGESKVPEIIIINFLRKNPSPNDALVHKFAQTHHYEVDDVEEAIYKIAGRHVREK